MTRLVLGVIGHVNHGKSTLVRALTGMDTDTLPEEKGRGVSIALGFAHLNVGSDATIDFIDMPGHEQFVRTMIAGATGLDAVLLVVAANEGVNAQTIEHVDIARLLGLQQAVLVITKTDVATPAQVAQAARDAAGLLEQAGLAHPKAIMTSSVDGSGLAELHSVLAERAYKPRSTEGKSVVYLPIDRAFSVTGHGPVVTGTLRGDTIAPGTELELLPARRSVRIRGVQVNGRGQARAEAGQRVALNLRGVDMAHLKRGMSLAEPAALPSSEWLTMSIRAVETAPPLKNGMTLRAFAGASELDVRLRLLDRDVLEPGARGFAQLRYATEITVPTREHVILRRASPPQTVAGGVILLSTNRRERRNDSQTLERLRALLDASPAEVIAYELARCGGTGTTLDDLAQVSGLSWVSVAEHLRTVPVIVTRSGDVFLSVDVEELVRRIPTDLESRQGGASHETLSGAFPAFGPAVLAEALTRLTASGAVQKRGGMYALQRPGDDQARRDNDGEVYEQIAETLRSSGLTPPNPGEIVTGPPSKRAVDRLLRQGIVIRAVDQAKGREMLFHREAIVDAQARLAPLLAEKDEGLLVTEIGAALGISRKFTMPLLAHLDATGFTRRVNDRRVPGAKTACTE